MNGYETAKTYFETIWINNPQREYILEVDLFYDYILHDGDDDFPMAPENIDIYVTMLSTKQHQLQMKYYGATCSSKHKLICSFLPNKHYVIYSPLLLFYLERGLQVGKVHRAIQFNASPILKDYIDYNAKQRRIFKSDETKKNFYKLMNNSPFGKSIENLTKRNTIKLYADSEKDRKAVSKQHCLDFQALSNNLFGVQLRRLIK